MLETNRRSHALASTTLFHGCSSPPWPPIRLNLLKRPWDGRIVLIGAVLIPGAAAPKLVNREMLKRDEGRLR